MKVKLSDYVASFFVEQGMSTVFTVTGGGAMHLNDSLGHNSNITCIYNHHEQASAMAAECYARMNNIIAPLCVTTGPGGTNALTGVLGGFLDSIPMLVVSGQVRFDTTVRSTGLPLRAYGDQEYDIIKVVEPMTKYCEMLTDPQKIRYCLEKAVYIATHGRPGPCWLDIPLNIQASMVEIDDLEPFDPMIYNNSLPKSVSSSLVEIVINKIKTAERPVFNVGNGVRLSRGYEVFRKVADKLGIPIVTGFNCIDLVESNHPLYIGRAGSLGDRPGNFAIQNSDLVLSVGSRLSLRQVSFNYESWAREAFVIMVDADESELRKPSLHVELPIHADAKDFLNVLDSELNDNPLLRNSDWIKQCQQWKNNYPVVLPEYYEEKEYTNVYCFAKELSKRLLNGQPTVASNGTACVCSSQAYEINYGQRYILNSAVAAMGYGLPAAIGACVANDGKETICIEGDGSLQMNIQELQTIRQHNLPIKLFVINNRGYHSIRMTQRNFFGEPLVGVGEDSGDLGFPSLEKVAGLYGFSFFRCKKNSELSKTLDIVLMTEGPVICEVISSTDYVFSPRSSSKRLPDGTMVSSPLEDLFPHLSYEELSGNMCIAMVEE